MRMIIPLFGFLILGSLAPISLGAEKVLPLAGEHFEVAGRPAFLIPGKMDSHLKGKPWVWYAPTLPGLPGKEERWMFGQFQEAGIAIGGIDTGESFGSPKGNSLFSQFYKNMTQSRGYSTKPVLLGRSRGGLMTLSWGTENPDKVGAFGGIYPVCNLASYPGIEKAAPAFDLTPEALRAQLKTFNPADRLSGLAKAKVPLFAIHGDVDAVVPLELNSGLVKTRYEAMGGTMELVIPKGQGHNMWSGFFESKELVQFVKTHALPQMILQSPLDFQVIQRTTKKMGSIPIKGQLPRAQTNPTDLEVRLINKSETTPWLKTGTFFEDGRFEGSVDAPAGGWYRMEIRAKKGDVLLAASTIEHVGIGEVFVIAGQSNSANHGEKRLKPRSPNVVAFDGARWQIANDPQPGASGDGGSFLPPFGDAITEKLGVPVGLVSCGVGATSIREWLPNGTRFPNPPTLLGNVNKLPGGEWESKGTIYTQFIQRIRSLGPKGFRAILWHQGESDANQSDSTRTLPGKLYYKALTKLIEDSRADIGWKVPWFVAQATYHVPGDEASPDIREAQAASWKNGLALEGPDSDQLKGDLRDSGGKGVHFSEKGQYAHAAKWAEKVIPWLEGQTK